MSDWKTDLDALVDETMAFAKSVRVGPTMPRTIVGPNRMPSVNWMEIRARGDQASRRQLQGASAAFHKGAGGLRRVRIHENAGISPVAWSAEQKGPGAIRGLPFLAGLSTPPICRGSAPFQGQAMVDLPSASAMRLHGPMGTKSRETIYGALSVPRRYLRTKRVGRLTGSPA